MQVNILLAVVDAEKNKNKFQLLGFKYNKIIKVGKNND